MILVTLHLSFVSYSALNSALILGQLDLSPFKASQTLLAKRKFDEVETGLKASITVFSIFDAKNDNEHGVAALVSGDMFPVREALKKANAEECVVNGVTIPMVSDCLKPKFISKQFKGDLMRDIPLICKDFGMYLNAQGEVNINNIYTRFIC